MTLHIPDWLPMFLLFAGSCFNVWLAYRYRESADRLLKQSEEIVAEWNDAITEAQALWDYGAHSEALQALGEAGVANVKVNPSAR